MQLVDSPIWHCDPNYITCRQKHPLKFAAQITPLIFDA
jgi:hypothetical protein